MKYNDNLSNFCFCSLIDGGTETCHITTEEAEYELTAMAEEAPEILAEIGNPLPNEFMNCWNEVVDYLTR